MLRRIIALFVFSLVLGLAQAGQVYAAPGAIFTVNQTADLPDANVNDGRCDTSLTSAGDQCSLRAAIQQANRTVVADTIRFVSTAQHTLTRQGAVDDSALNGDLDIKHAVTLEPNPGGRTIIAGVSGFTERIFDIREGAVVTIRRLEIRNGHVAEGGGGGIQVNLDAHLNLNDSVIIQNSAELGGGIFNRGLLEIRGTTIRSNQAFDGGGIYNQEDLTMVDSTVSTNTSSRGGGLYNNDNSVATPGSIVNSTFSGNQSLTNGGGIENSIGTLNLFNVTIAKNTADSNNNGDGSGGGIRNTISGTLNFVNTVIADNFDLSANEFAPDCLGTLNSNSFNALENGNGCTLTGSTTGNLNGANPGLGNLQNNGGLTNTHAILAGSILIDAGDPSGCQDHNNVNLSTDQRGLPRPTDGNGDGTPRCDIGAFEVGAVGIGSVSPNKGSSEAKEQVVFDLAWDSPTRWRDLDTMDLRFKRGKDILLWLRFTEALPTSTISLLDNNGSVVDSGAVGQAGILKNKFGSVDLAQSDFTAAGPNDPHVVVHFAVTFKGNARGKARIQMSAADDLQNTQGPEPAGKWRVE